MSAKKHPVVVKAADRETFNRVRANFIAKGSSFFEWCEQNNINRRNAESAVLGKWAGKKGKALRSQVIQASKAKTTAKTQ